MKSLMALLTLALSANAFAQPVSTYICETSNSNQILKSETISLAPGTIKLVYRSEDRAVFVEEASRASLLLAVYDTTKSWRDDDMLKLLRFGRLITSLQSPGGSFATMKNGDHVSCRLQE